MSFYKKKYNDGRTDKSIESFKSKIMLRSGYWSGFSGLQDSFIVSFDRKFEGIEWVHVFVP